MTKPYIIASHHDSVHPFTGEPGWSQMIVKFKNEKAEEAFTEAASNRGWQLLISGWDNDPHVTGESLPMCLYFKPHGRGDPKAENWVDPRPWPYPEDWF